MFLCLDALVWDTSHSQILLPPFCAALSIFSFVFLWADQASHLSHPFSRFQFPVALASLPKPLTCTPFSGALITLSIACNNTDVFPPLAFFFFSLSSFPWSAVIFPPFSITQKQRQFNQSSEERLKRQHGPGVGKCR